MRHEVGRYEEGHRGWNNEQVNKQMNTEYSDMQASILTLNVTLISLLRRVLLS